jgi:ribosomal protein L16 Arg81 hydroxylase
MTPEFLWPLRPGVETIGGRTDYLDLQGQRVGRALDASQLETIEVKPGDLIFLPAGTWHQAHPIDEDTLGLELVFTRLTTTDVLLGVLQDHLNTTECRYDPPLLLADETAPWSLPEEARQFFAARIEQLKAFVRNLEADDVNLQRVWKQKANGLIPHPDTRMRQPIRVTGTETGTEHTTRSAKRADVTPDTWLALSERGPIKAVFAADADGDRTYLYQQEAALCFEGTRAAHFAREIVRRQKQPLRAAEALSWESSPPFSWDVIKPVLQRLVDSGFLAVVG